MERSKKEKNTKGDKNKAEKTERSNRKKNTKEDKKQDGSLFS
jgi:hypothetical protein